MRKINSRHILFLVLSCVALFSYLLNSGQFSFLTRAVAAVFDSDLIPSRDNLWSIGLAQPSRWKDGRFSGIIDIGIDSTREQEINGSDRLVIGPADATNNEGGQIKLFGPSSGNYTILDNYNNDFRVITK